MPALLLALVAVDPAPAQAQAQQCVSGAITLVPGDFRGTVCQNPDGTITVTNACGTGTFTQAQLTAIATGQQPVPQQFLCSAAQPSTAAFLASLGQIAQQTSRVGMMAAQSQITSIRDRIQRRTPDAVPPAAFAAEPPQAAVSRESPWPALGYARDPKSPMVAKAPLPPAAPAVRFATWTQGYYDYERRSGIFDGVDIGRRTNTLGGLAGVDATFIAGTDAWVFGLLGGYMDARVRNNDGTTADIQAPSVGVYAIFVRGSFSADGIVKVDFIDLGTSVPQFASLGMTNYSVAGNLSYRFDFANCWFEPTAGLTWTKTVWDGGSRALGFTDGHQVRLQAGARTGTSFQWGSVRVEPVLGAFVYGDAEIEGGTLSTVFAPVAPTDEGKVFGMLTGKVGLDYGRGLSTYVEGELRGGDQVFGAAARVGLRYAFQ